ncbi:MAG: CDP-alcohol phosphatidyltransferase family protein [Actinobacteria bacterium]|nr:CDP-alcohol phosphatidyltransferase family protein [Actinomycetota bacterium]
MLDHAARRVLDPGLRRVAAAIDRPWVTPDRLTLLGLAVGLGSAAAAAAAWWLPALLLWLANRVLDGLDGPLARRRTGASKSVGASEAGGFLDIACDFTVYGATVMGVALGTVSTFGADWRPFALVLLAYYINGSAFLAFSSIAERTGRRIDDGRSLSFIGGLAEGTETVLVHSLWLILPQYADKIALVWAAVVAVSATQRIVGGYRALR